MQTWFFEVFLIVSHHIVLKFVSLEAILQWFTSFLWNFIQCIFYLIFPDQFLFICLGFGVCFLVWYKCEELTIEQNKWCQKWNDLGYPNIVFWQYFTLTICILSGERVWNTKCYILMRLTGYLQCNLKHFLTLLFLNEFLQICQISSIMINLLYIFIEK